MHTATYQFMHAGHSLLQEADGPPLQDADGHPLQDADMPPMKICFKMFRCGSRKHISMNDKHS